MDFDASHLPPHSPAAIVLPHMHTHAHGHEPEILELEDLASLSGPWHLAIGVFDGIHIGHQEVIRRATDAAARDGGHSAVLTFEPNPIRVIAPHAELPPWLGTLGQTRSWLASLPGSPALLPLRFDESLARLEPGDFLDALTRADIRTIAAGEDWKFGHNRAGNATFLKTHAEARDYHVEIVGEVDLDGERVSSTRIRHAVRDGRLDEAATLLGRPHTVRGTVVEGRKLGRTIGFPTANIDTAGACLPPDGVWAVHFGLAGEPVDRSGVANLGIRPTIAGRGRQLEVHVFDFTENLYGRRVDVIFREFIRPEKKFDGIDALKAQIEADARIARAMHTR
jgi:riboflavin kinase / FMN adenylyltransferase